LLNHYNQLLQQHVLCEDKAQFCAVTALAELSEQLVISSNNSTLKYSTLKKSSINLIKKLFSKQTKPQIKGLYFYGRVGRGKTMLMDLFYQNIALKHKRRIHFHRFMESVHQQLNELSVNKSSKGIGTGINPLTVIAKTWATDIELLCFDEFFVSDIGDAMLLAGLFKELFSLGVTLVTTSNCRPDQLYRNGLQRELFLPTIALINQYCHVISIDGETDHRLTNIVTQQYKNYYFLHENGEQKLAQRFVQYSDQKPNSLNDGKSKHIIVNHREIPFLAKTNKHIWFDFYALCSGPRSQRDYMQLADLFDTVLISNVPQFSGKLVPAVFSGVEDSYQRSGVLMADLRQLDDEARRFIALVDEFYDRKVALIISAEVDISQLYQGQQLSFEFQRCQSRLFEMQKD